MLWQNSGGTLGEPSPQSIQEELPVRVDAPLFRILLVQQSYDEWWLR